MCTCRGSPVVGILFLTTNRVGIFDEAFTSRLHVSIHYPRLEEKERRQIWKYHVRRVEQVRQDLDVRESVSDYVENSKELKKIAFNGRQVRTPRTKRHGTDSRQHRYATFFRLRSVLPFMRRGAQTNAPVCGPST